MRWYLSLTQPNPRLSLSAAFVQPKLLKFILAGQSCFDIPAPSPVVFIEHGLELQDSPPARAFRPERFSEEPGRKAIVFAPDPFPRIEEPLQVYDALSGALDIVTVEIESGASPEQAAVSSQSNTTMLL